MAKSKNHSTHNQNHKNHRNGIKKPQRQKFASLKCVNAKYLRNRRRAIKFDGKQNKNVARYRKAEEKK
jgi:large subunit ribosomal protein L29e